MRHLLTCLFLAASLQAIPALDHARQARELLGSETWSRVLKIENSARHSVYPENTYALAFEFNDMLWLYTSYDGTQSLSLYHGRVDSEKADMGPLLKAVAPGFDRFVVVPDSEAPTPAGFSPEQLPNGCFVRSLAALRQKMGREWVRHAALLCYYYGPRGRQGHTVLTYQDSAGLWVWDPDFPEAPTLQDNELASDARRLAQSVHSTASVARARFVPIRLEAFVSGAAAASAGESGAAT